MLDEYNAFFRILRPISRYAVDLTLAEIHHDKLRRPFKISHKGFLKDLYQERGDESHILSFLENNDDFLCLIGPKGCGKTSLGLKIKDTLSRSLKPRVFVVFIDTRIQNNLHRLHVYSESPARFEAFLLDHIKKRYVSELFNYDATNPHGNPKIKLWEFLLSPAKHLVAREIFVDLQDLIDEAAELFDAYCQDIQNTENGISYYEWLRDTHHKDPDVKSLTRKLSSLIKIPHLVYAARSIHRYSRQYIWFDNIDALPIGLQKTTVRTLKENYSTISDYVATIISIREENVLNLYDVEHGAPPHITRVQIDIERDERGHAIYSPMEPGHPAIGVPIVESKVLKSIVNKRLSVTWTYQKDKAQDRSNRISKWEKRLEKATDNEAKQKIRQRIEELRKELRFYGPVPTVEQFQDLIRLSDKMFEALDMERAIFLANNSIREYLPIYRDFLAELSKIPSDRHKILEDARQIATLFFRWVHSTQRSFRIGIYDVIEETESWYENKDASIGCILPHLLITTIWNLTLENPIWIDERKRFENPSILKVVERLSSIGYTREHILNAIFALYKVEYENPDGEMDKLYGSVIEFRSRGFIDRVTDIKDEYRVYVTHRGKCFVGLTSNTFGYLSSCVGKADLRRLERSHEKVRNEDKESLDSGSIPYIGASLRFLPYLRKIAQMHYETLKKIRDTVFESRTDWLTEYCQWFGIPRIKPYTRRKTSGILIHGVERALQFDVMVDGLLSYLSEDPSSRKLSELRDLYRQAIENLSTFDEGKSPPVDFLS